MSQLAIAKVRESVLALPSYTSAAIFISQDKNINLVSIEEKLGAALAVIQWGKDLGRRRLQAIKQEIIGTEVGKDIIVLGMKVLEANLRKQNVQVVREAGTNLRNELVSLRALTVFAKEKKIILYKQQIADIAEIANIRYQFLENLHLAHEVFHVWEFVEEKEISKTVFFSCQKTGRKRKIFSSRLSELAAHAFAWGFVQTSFFPLNLDFLQQVCLNPTIMTELLTANRQMSELIKLEAVETFTEEYARKIGEMTNE